MPLGSFYHSVREYAELKLEVSLGRFKMLIPLHTARTSFLEKLENGSSLQVDLYGLTIKSIGGL